MKNFFKNFGLKTLIICLWVLIWYVADQFVDSKLIMAGPKDTLISLKSIINSDEFIFIIKNSLGKIFSGLFFAVILALALSIIAYNFVFIREFLKPAILLMKSIPVASFVILALIWIGSKDLSELVVFLITFPILYTQLLNGYINTNKKNLEFSKDFRLSFLQKNIYIYLPSVFNAFVSAIELSVGMSFKAGIAAEVIGQPVNSIGEELYFAKLYFETGLLFAWTLIILVLSGVSEILIKYLLKNISKLTIYLTQLPFKKDNVSKEHILQDNAVSNRINSFKNNSLIFENISKTYDDNLLFKNVSFTLKSGEIAAVTGNSGIGKTTLLSIIADKVKPDTGNMNISFSDISILYQDTRFFEFGNSLFNVSVVMNDITEKEVRTKIAVEMLTELLDFDDLFKPVSKLSGGMQRRVEIVRAFAKKSDLIILDEPFRGLDENNRKKVAAFINKYKCDRLVIASVHSSEEANLLMPNVILNL